MALGNAKQLQDVSNIEGEVLNIIIIMVATFFCHRIVYKKKNCV